MTAVLNRCREHNLFVVFRWKPSVFSSPVCSSRLMPKSFVCSSSKTTADVHLEQKEEKNKHEKRL